MRILKISILILSLTFPAFGQLSGGGDLNPDLKAPKKEQEKWQDLKVGLSVHWGPSSLGGKEISWSRDRQIKKEVYDNYYKQFNPVKFDAEEWATLMDKWGMKFIAPTAKHHDGFCLWFSEFTDYDMENAKLKVDIMAELKKACDKHGIMLGAYYSNLDWYHPDWYPYNFGGPGPLFEKKDDSPNLDRYFKFFENQCKELITKYDLEFVQFDGEWDSTYTHEIGSKLYRKFHEVKPNILLNSRIDIGRRAKGSGNHILMDGQKYCGDFQDRERLVNHGNKIVAWADHPWQAWVTLDKRQWSYNKTPKLLTKDELILDLVDVVGHNGNYMINLGPRPDGSFEKAQVQLMDHLGLWLKKHAKAIYKTRGGPFYPFQEGVSTRRGKKAWLFIKEKDAKKLYLPKLKQRLKKAYVFGTKTKVPFTIENGMYVFDLSNINYDGPVEVVELKFNKKVEMSTVKKAKNKFEVAGAERIIEDIRFEVSSLVPNWEKNGLQKHLFDDHHVPNVAILTKAEVNPNIIIDLQKQRQIFGMFVHCGKYRNKETLKDLTLWISEDGKDWKEYWTDASENNKWTIPLTTESMGAQVLGKKVRFLKLGLKGDKEQKFQLSKIEMYGK